MTDTAKNNVVQFSDRARAKLHAEKPDTVREIFMREMNRRAANLEPVTRADGECATLTEALDFALDRVDDWHKRGGGYGCGAAGECVQSLKAATGGLLGITIDRAVAESWRDRMRREAFEWQRQWVKAVGNDGKHSFLARHYACAKSVTYFAAMVCEVALMADSGTEVCGVHWCPLETAKAVASKWLGKTDGTIGEDTP